MLGKTDLITKGLGTAKAVGIRDVVRKGCSGKRRTRIPKVLKDFGDRVQYSVFECNLNEELLDLMVDRVEKIVAPEADRVRIYTLCAACNRIIKIIGTGEVTTDQDIYIV